MLELWVGSGDDPSPTFSAGDVLFDFTTMALPRVPLAPTYTFFLLLWHFLSLVPQTLAFLWVLSRLVLLPVLHTVL